MKLLSRSRWHRRIALAMCWVWLLSFGVTLAQACVLPALATSEGVHAAARSSAVSAPEVADHAHDVAAHACQAYCEDTRISPVQIKPWADLLDAAIPGSLPSFEAAPAATAPSRMPALHDPAPPEPAVYIRFLRLTI